MASSFSSILHLFLFSSLFLFIISSPPPTLALSKPKPPKPTLFLPVSKFDATSLQTKTQYITHIKQRTPLVTVNLTVDLGSSFTWVVIDDDYISSTRTTPPCNSTPCKLATRKKYCQDNACVVSINHPTLHGIVQVGPVCQDVLSLQSTNSSYLTLPHYIFPCATNYMIPGLPDGVTGVAGLGQSRISLPSQLSLAFGLDKKFAICLPSSSKAKGFIVFGNNGIDTSYLPLTYTPLLSNPVSTVIAPRGEPSYEYFIGVKSVTINNKVVPFNTSMLVIDRKSGYGGTKISTSYSYSTLKTEIYKAFIEAFVREAEAMKLKRVAAVEPFAACFSSKGVARTKLGPAVPTIDLVLESGVWRMFGGNSMVEVGKGVMCLGFVEEEIQEFKDEEERTSIVIGGHQLEDIVLQFDLASSTMGFSSAQSTCSKYFNFTYKLA